MRDTQRGPQNYMKKRRGRREIGVSRRRKGGDTGGERQIYAVICSQSVLCRPDTHKDSQNWIEKRRRREETEVIWGKKGESKGERVIITLLSKNGY